MSCGHYPTLSSSIFVYVSLIDHIEKLETEALSLNNSEVLLQGLLACKTKLNDYFDRSTFESEYYYFATCMFTLSP